MNNNVSLSLVIPVFNEEARLPITFSSLIDFLPKSSFKEIEIIFVDDGSTDRTKSLIEEFNILHPVRCISYKPNRGKGYAVQKGMLAARCDYALLLDADMSTPLREIEKMIPYIHKGCAVIIGSRKMGGANVLKRQAWHRQKMGEVFTILARIITSLPLSDFTCGFKCFSREAIGKIFPRTKINRWSYDAEILFIAKKFNLKIHEVPITWINDEATKVQLFRDSIKSFIELIKIRANNMRGNYS